MNSDFMKCLEASSLKAFLFDMDGVLFDSMKNHATAWTKAVEQFGLFMTREEVYMNEGRTGNGTINALMQRTYGREATPEECDRIYAYKSELFNQCPIAPPMPGALDVLNKVRALGKLPVIVTGSGQRSLLDRLNKHFPGIFRPELMVTAFDVKYGKPNPEPYLMGLMKAGAVLNADGSPLKPSEAIVVENAPLGVKAAKAAGIYTVAVNTGPLSDSVLEEEGADIVFPGMMAFAEAFE